MPNLPTVSFLFADCCAVTTSLIVIVGAGAPPPQPLQTSIGNIETRPDVVSSVIGDLPLKKESVPTDLQKSLSFDEIPGPLILQSIAKFWKVIPVMGTEVTANAIQYMLSAGKIFGKSLLMFCLFYSFPIPCA